MKITQHKDKKPLRELIFPKRIFYLHYLHNSAAPNKIDRFIIPHIMLYRIEYSCVHDISDIQRRFPRKPQQIAYLIRIELQYQGYLYQAIPCGNARSVKHLITVIAVNIEHPDNVCLADLLFIYVFAQNIGKLWRSVVLDHILVKGFGVFKPFLKLCCQQKIHLFCYGFWS